MKKEDMKEMLSIARELTEVLEEALANAEQALAEEHAFINELGGQVKRLPSQYGFEGKAYFATDKGAIIQVEYWKNKVFTKQANGKGSGGSVGRTESNSGYRQLWLALSTGKQDLRYVHRVIAETYHAKNGVIPDGLEVNHISSDKFDNRPSNLEIVTHAQNMRHYKQNRKKEDNE
ncbi:HNH endonuclease [Listeria monocytogenes]|nr:HNH endonuclease [Listeria monocytogenes]